MTQPTSCRRTIRVSLNATVGLRRSMGPYCPAKLKDLSSHGCSVDLVDRVKLDEVLWVKFPGIEARQGMVCWESEYTCGIEFEMPFHPAVMDMLAAKLGA